MPSLEDKETYPLRCVECNYGYFISDKALICISCEDYIDITAEEILKRKKALIKIQDKIKYNCKKLGYERSIEFISSYRETIANEIITKQISFDDSLKSFKKWIGCSFTLTSLHRFIRHQKVYRMKKKDEGHAKKRIIRLITKLSFEYSDLHLVLKDSMIIVRHNESDTFLELVPFDKPLYQTPSFINDGNDRSYHNNLDQAHSMFHRDAFKNSHLTVLASFLRINFKTINLPNKNFQKNIEELLIELRNSYSSYNSIAKYLLLISKKELKNSEFKKLSSIINNLAKYGSHKTEDLELELFPVLPNSISSKVYVGLRSLQLINFILNRAKLDGETEQERGAWVEDMNFRPFYGINVENELNGRKLLNVMNSDTKSRWKEIADFIVIGNNTNKVYVFEVKSRLVTTMKWMEKELDRYLLKIPAIKEELIRLDIPVDDVEFLFINKTTAVSNYKGIIVGSPSELTYRTALNEGFKKVKLHNEEDTIQFHKIDHLRGIHELNGRRYRLDIGVVLGVNEEDREIGLIGMSPDNNQALIYIDVPEFIDLPTLSEHDKILFLAEDTMGGDVILSLHDWKLLSTTEWIIWLSTPYLADYEHMKKNPPVSSPDGGALMISLYQSKALESLNSNWKKIAKSFYFSYMGPIASALFYFPFIEPIIHDIVSHIADDLPVAIYTHRKDNSKIMVFVPYNGEMGVKARIATTIEFKRLEPEFSEFTQAFWFLITSNFFPNPKNEPERFESMLLMYVGKDLFE